MSISTKLNEGQTRLVKLLNRLSWISAAGLAVLISGCTVRSEPIVTASYGETTELANVALALEAGAPASRVSFFEALQSEFGDRIARDQTTADYFADYSIAVVAADVPLYSGEAGASDVPPESVVTVRESKWTDECKSSRARATLAIYKVADGMLVSRHTAEAITCEGEVPPYRGLAEVLIEATKNP